MLFSLFDSCTNGARMLSVERLSRGNFKAFRSRIVNEHSNPGARLHDSPVTARNLQERKQGEHQTKALFGRVDA